jgi:hypothetical protein
MKNKIPKPTRLLLVLTLINILGCHNSATNTKTDLQDAVKPAEKVIMGSRCDTTIINQEFSYQALAFKVFKADTNKIRSLFLNPVVLKMEKHTNFEGGTYYLDNFSDGVNTITLLPKAGEGFYIQEADIKNDKILLNKKISIGMNKDIFLRLFKVTTFKCDTITVKDEELTFESVYIFKDAKLKQIKMGQILE